MLRISNRAGAYSDSSARVCMELEDMVMEILSWLPAKEAIRMTHVSRKWRELISSDYFRRIHTLRRHKPSGSALIKDMSQRLFYLAGTENAKRKLVPLDAGLNGKNLTVLEGCGGLLLLSSIRRRGRTTYYVHNPATRQSRQIDIPHHSEYPHVTAVNLAFDPLVSPHYKVVCLSCMEQHSDFTYRVDVYESESGRWKMVLESITTPLRLFFGGRAVFWNGAVYWSTGTCFDIAMNQIQRIRCPPERPQVRSRDCLMLSYMQEVEGHLYFFERSKIGDGVVVWELREDAGGAAWVQRWVLRIPPHPIKGGCYSIARYMGGGADGPSCCFVSHVGCKMSVYRFLDRVYEDVVDFSEDRWYVGNPVMFGLPFCEVLASV